MDTSLSEQARAAGFLWFIVAIIFGMIFLMGLVSPYSAYNKTYHLVYSSEQKLYWVTACSVLLLIERTVHFTWRRLEKKNLQSYRKIYP